MTKSKWKKWIATCLAACLLLPGWMFTAVAADNGTEVIYHETFADGIGKTVRSGEASLEHVTGKNFPGNDNGGALYVSNRVNSWDAADYYIQDLDLQEGATYAVKAVVYVDSEEDVPAGAQFAIPIVHQDNSNRLWAGVNIVPGETVTLTQEFTVNRETDKAIRIQTNNEGSTVPYYIGEVLITKVASGSPGSEEPGTEEPGTDQDIVLLADFEDGIGDWYRRFGDGGIEVTSEANATPGGSNSLKTTVSQQYDGPILSVRDKLEANTEYRLSAKVRMAPGQSPTLIRISVQYGQSNFSNVSANVNVTDEDWFELTGLYTQYTPPGDVLNAYVEIALGYGEARTFYIDDFTITKVGTLQGPNPDYTLPSIKEVYADYFPIGSIMNPGGLEGDRLQMLQKHFNLLTAENFMKPEYAYIRGTTEFDLSNQIALVEEALAKGFNVHGHVLVWHSQSPDWLHTQVDENGTPLRDENNNILYLSKEEALYNLRRHIKTVVEAIGDRVISWDVVNEAMNDNPPNPTDWENALHRSGWYYAIGPDYLYEAYKAAREVIDEHGWDIELYYNDYNDDNQNKATAIAEMVKDLNERYAEETGSNKKLIDGIGMQGHYNINTNPENVRASIERFIDVGVKIGVTELDVMAGQNRQLTEDQAKAQAYLYAQLFQLYKEYADHITRVTFWGLDDGTSWRSENSPLLFDRLFQAKPAYYAVIDPEKYIEENKPEEKEYRQSEAAYGTPVIDGTEDEVWKNAPELPIDRYQMAFQGANGTARALWDEDHLYVLFHVNDAELDDAAQAPHEQDSVEVFLDENNAKASSYQEDDAQYRVNFKNVATFNALDQAGAAEGFESATVVNATYTGYTVEIKIPFRTITPENGTKIGFDAQINDGKNGSRQSVATWNDLTGQGWQDPSVFGVLTLTGKPDDDGDGDDGGGDTGGGNTGGGYNWTIMSPAPTVRDGIVTIKPTVSNVNGRAKATLTSGDVERSVDLATADGNGIKRIVIEVDSPAGTNAVDVELPTASLAGDEGIVFSLKTPQGTIDLPGNMLKGIAPDTRTVTVSIANVDAGDLAEAIRGEIGNRPVISLDVTAGGQSIAWNNPDAPVTVTIPYEPTAEERANPDHIVIWHIDDEGNITAVPNGRYDADKAGVVFRTTHFSAYAVAYTVKSFDDLAGVPWAKKAIEAMASRGIIAGVSDTNFNPSANIKRADFVALLVRALELQDTGEAVTMFGDVKASDYFYGELRIAKQHGIASGTGDNRFNPNGFITRQDMMVLADKALQAAGKSLQGQGALGRFPDAGDVSGYARASADKLVASGIVSGMNGKLAPKEQLTRAQAAVILYQLWNR